ncbi:class II glutamine amidotransferase [Mesorhizobium sp. Z1-4]|uniref:class II glutamine amidotransferase n=1 Tax=Mesorhizobium sp. Z1-4 TaxID=2448478 RepID=UPI000FDC4B69|nr:class II glutamine amidotransferase [Mesorhizobium sp. Z1-4]
MCRWAAYRGGAIFLEDIVSAPCHSLVAQSHCAQEAKTATNGDGFGVAWYGERAEPGLYRDILPAWSDPNLRHVCHQVRSHLFLAHVRASTTGATSRDNCHPFVSGNWSFMHNGQIGGFEQIRRRLESSLPDHLYAERHGSTDSELLFLIMLAEGLDRDPHGATQRAVNRVSEAARDAGVEPFVRLTAAFSDGQSLYAVRYASDRFAPTLYLSTGAHGHSLVSEPLDSDGAAWQPVPAGSFVKVDASGAQIRPFAPAADALAIAV